MAKPKVIVNMTGYTRNTVEMDISTMILAGKIPKSLYGDNLNGETRSPHNFFRGDKMSYPIIDREKERKEKGNMWWK